LTEFIGGKLVGGGGICESCGRRIEEGERVYSLSSQMDEIKEYLYCHTCRPDETELPKGVLSLEPAQAVEEIGLDERRLGFEVKAGSLCSRCGHYFEEDEWLFVGVVEGLHRGFVYCCECYESESEKEL